MRERTQHLEDAIAEQKRLEAALVHAQRMEAVGALTGGVAHNFNSLLTVVIARRKHERQRLAPGPAG